ncbi:MAG: phage baseplate assembly protein V [Pseudomonadota bacterium]
MIKDIDNRIRRALGSIRLAFRGVVTLVKAAGAVQLVQVDGLQGEQLQDAELFQHYGLTSNPPVGTMAIVLPIGGRTAHGIIIATEHGTYRLKNLASGEMAIYDDQGQKVHITRAGIVIDGAGKPINIQNTSSVTMTTPLVHATGAMTIDGLLTVGGGMTISGGSGNTVNGSLATTGALTNNGKNVGSSHAHSGVQAGGSNTGAPI